MQTCELSLPPVSPPGQLAGVLALPNAGVQGCANRPLHNARNIDEFSNLLFHQRFGTVDEVVSTGNMAERNSRERDLLTMMYSMSTATLCLVVNGLCQLITDIMAVNPSPVCLYILVDVSRLAMRLRH